jgi:serine/threonine protein kinase
MEDLVGKTIGGKYRVVERLGRGGMAEVYKALQTSLERYVAIKVMHPFLADAQGFAARFEREAKSVAALHHPNIVQVYDFDVEAETPYMVMEFIEGATLKTRLESLSHRGQPLPLKAALKIVREIGHALAYAHKRNVVHRDVKPANVMVDTGGRVILTDFGIAKILTGPSYTASGATIGTPAYMAPEQGLGQSGDHRSDLYSLGVMLYQLTTGELPFDADTPMAVMLKHINEDLPPPHSVNPNLPESVERVILKSMAKKPADRYQTVDEMLADLEKVGAAARTAAPSPAPSPGAATEFAAAPVAAAPSPTVIDPPPAQPAPPTVVASSPETARAPSPTPKLKKITPPPAEVVPTLHKELRTLLCSNCSGAGLELQPDGQAACRFCGTVNALAGPICPFCEVVNEASAEVCANCGRGLVRTCPACEALNWSGAERCVNCGQALDTLDHLMNRLQEGTVGRLNRQMAESRSLKQEEQVAAQRRSAYFEALEERRQQELAEAKRKADRERQTMQAIAIGAVVVVLIVIAAIVAFSLLR